MGKTIPIRILYVGRRSRASEDLACLVADHAELESGGRRGNGHVLEFVSSTNQRTALAMIRTQPPNIVMVETDAKLNSRARFSEMIRYRLPTAAILAVSRVEPRGSFLFDEFVQVPINGEKVIHALRHICLEHDAYQLQEGDVFLNIATRTVVSPLGRYHMTPKQCALLKMLMQHHGQVVHRKELMESIWKTDYLEDTRTLDVHVRWLRERIEPEPSAPIFLETVRGVGYRLQLK